MLEMLSLIVFGGLLIYAACSDVATMTIPNWVSIALAAAFPVIALAEGLSATAILVHLGFGLVVLLAGFLLFQFGVLGGGDAKLIASAAVWTGIGAFPPFAAWTMMVGGLLALLLLTVRARLKPGEARPAFVNRLLKPRGGVPYGVAILAGGIASLGGLPLLAGPLTLP